VRDPVLSEALKRLAAEAATRFTSLVATGEEIPFDVAEDDGEHTFYRYRPLTAVFLAEHEGELHSLPSFGPACAAVGAAGIAAPYLESRGLPVPADEDERSAKMLLAFVTALWDGCGEFTLERPRLEGALRQLEAEVSDPAQADFLIVPLVGLQMPLRRLQLPSGVRVATADSVDAPPEALRSEGMQRNAWQPQFLALADQDEDASGSSTAMRQLRELVSVMRLFKEGGVALGPYAFAPAGEGEWRPLSTGAPATRPGGYKLSENEASELAEFARRLESRPDPGGALRWALRRFEMACDRPNALEGLSDHLLALRAVLAGDGPVGAAAALRAASLIAEPADRELARERVEEAFELERRLMSGRPPEDTGAALGLAVWIEDGLRSILRDAALGELGSDLSTAADENLVAAGLSAGEGSATQMGGTDEWEAVPPEPEGEEITVTSEQETEPAQPTFFDHDENGRDVDQDEEEEEAWPPPNHNEETTVSSSEERDWLSEVSRLERETLEFPARVTRRESEEKLDTPRVRHLFPVPDETEWDIGELEYDRTKASVRR
jgi:hypothetical protein